jgi:hypothetical protein
MVVTAWESSESTPLGKGSVHYNPNYSVQGVLALVFFKPLLLPEQCV